MVDPSTDPRASSRVPWGTVQLSALELRKQAAIVADEAPPTGRAYAALAYAICNLCSALAGYYAPHHVAPHDGTERRLALLEVAQERQEARAGINSAMQRLALPIAILALFAALWR